MGTVITVIAALLIFSIIVFVHEFGHFFTAKLFKVKVHEFAIGMGPALFKKQKGETLYSVRAIPMGGFCAMEGENGESEDPRSFGKQAKWKRFIILVSGALMNLLLGLIIMIISTAVFSKGGFITTTIDSVVPGSAAYEAGILPGDRIISVNGYSTGMRSEIDIYGSFSETDTIKVKRGNKTLTFSITPRETEYVSGGQTYKAKMLGVTFSTLPKNFFTVMEYSWKNSLFLGKTVFISLKWLLNGTASATELSGPVGIVNEINNAAKNGLADILYLMCLITINLGIFNLLPIPALDGGRVLFIIIEAIIRKPIPPKYEGLCHAIGFILLIGLMLFATWNDISRIFIR